ncbi:hypothetical protein [Paenibacillus sp. JDR-2]|uniref:hypothetical protein n=1 Tax=Paenibacillus sp. (strain JDR-2) TaxID=324057 RepID=UPI000166A418|nr:hypothetical protein [Paenibacillus sp. JDR-2]ACT00071.1 hypothetical protein Pjdr2_1396 [Paenibacillus sp. JDR-2]
MYGCNWQQGSNNSNGHQCHKSHKSHRSNGGKSTGTGNTGTGNTGTGNTELRNLVGEFVRINRGGPESLEGKLLAVKNDYLVLSTREGVVYVDLSHVKSVTGFATSKSGGTCTDYINANNFRGVVTALTKEFVQINWGGPEKVEGFLAEVQGNTALVVANNQVVYILVDHIKTIKKLGGKSGGNKSGNNKSGGNKNNNNKSGNNQGGNKSGNKNNNKSGAQQSGANKTGNRTGAQAQGQSTGNKSKKSGGSNRSKKG